MKILVTGGTGLLGRWVVKELLNACRAVRDAVSRREEGRARKEVPGARILGIHLEGPYVNPARRGRRTRRT